MCAEQKSSIRPDDGEELAKRNGIIVTSSVSSAL
jgi:hypothetical protein